MKTPNSRGGKQEQEELVEHEKKQNDGEVQEQFVGQRQQRRMIVVKRMPGRKEKTNVGSSLREHSRAV